MIVKTSQSERMWNNRASMLLGQCLTPSGTVMCRCCCCSFDLHIEQWSLLLSSAVTRPSVWHRGSVCVFKRLLEVAQKWKSWMFHSAVCISNQVTGELGGGWKHSCSKWRSVAWECYASPRNSALMSHFNVNNYVNIHCFFPSSLIFLWM